MSRALIALGANLGDRAAALGRAIELLAAEPEIFSLRASRFHETPPAGGPANQGAFLNAAATFETTLSPHELHALLGSIEEQLGRRRDVRWAARAIDLDLLLYDEQVIHTPTLDVPHPRMAFRRFVLVPAAEVAADMRHPEIGWTVGQLLAHLDAAPRYVALLGPPASEKTALAARVARDRGARLILDPAADVPPSHAGDSPSRLLGRQIQFLDRRRAVLDRAAWPPQTALAISDFYFDQALVYARRELDDAGYADFFRSWREASEHMVRPGLLVLLDDPRPRAETAAKVVLSTTESRAPSQSLAARLMELAQRDGVGPVLYAGRGNAQAQYEEITAAITAMQLEPRSHR